MGLGQYNPHMRYRERAAQRLANGLRLLAFIIVAIIIGFWIGKQYGAEQLITLKESLVVAQQERDELQAKMTEISAAAQTANARYDQLQEEVQSVIPKGPMQDLVTLLREQIKKGTDPERLSFVIRSARPPTGCADPDTKRFVVSTPANAGPKSSARIADAITVSGDGVSARSQQGAPEAWYDPAKTIEVYFEHDGKKEVKKGILPLRHSMVVEDREYRFTIEQGARSFAKVVFDSCDYP